MPGLSRNFAIGAIGIPLKLLQAVSHGCLSQVKTEVCWGAFRFLSCPNLCPVGLLGGKEALAGEIYRAEDILPTEQNFPEINQTGLSRCSWFMFRLGRPILAE